jgi:hypothetical protein
MHAETLLRIENLMRVSGSAPLNGAMRVMAGVAFRFAHGASRLMGVALGAARFMVALAAAATPGRRPGGGPVSLVATGGILLAA